MAAPAADRLGRKILGGVVLGVVLYAVIALAGDIDELGTQLRKFPLEVFLGALGLSVVNYSIRWAKWHYYLHKLECVVDVRASIVIFAAGLTMSITPGKVGEVLKSVLLERSHGYPIARTAPIVIGERVTDLLALFVIAGLGIGVFDYGRWAFAGIVGAVVAGILLLQSQTAVQAVLSLAERLPKGERIRGALEEAYISTRVLIELRPLLVATGLSVLSWSMEAVAFWWILDALGVSASLYVAAFIYAMTTILGAVSFLPGGLGVTEGTMIGALVVLGVTPDEVVATTATYLIRIATLWFGVVVGIVGLAAFRTVASRATKPLPR